VRQRRRWRGRGRARSAARAWRGTKRPGGTTGLHAALADKAAEGGGGRASAAAAAAGVACMRCVQLALCAKQAEAAHTGVLPQAPCPRTGNGHPPVCDEPAGGGFLAASRAMRASPAHRTWGSASKGAGQVDSWGGVVLQVPKWYSSDGASTTQGRHCVRLMASRIAASSAAPRRMAAARRCEGTKCSTGQTTSTMGVSGTRPRPPNARAQRRVRAWAAAAHQLRTALPAVAADWRSVACAAASHGPLALLLVLTVLFAAAAGGGGDRVGSTTDRSSGAPVAWMGSWARCGGDRGCRVGGVVVVR
jgi:hypothetical protein